MMHPLHSVEELIFKEDPSSRDLLTILALLATSWGSLFAVSIPLLSNALKKQAWFRSVSDADYERSAQVRLQQFGVLETRDEFYERFSIDFPWWCCVCVQHSIGGLLCLPSMLGFWDDSTASSLVCLGILSEIGWEMTDILRWLHRRYLTKNGKQQVPGKLLLAVALHHSLTSLLGIPMIYRYRHLRALHFIGFELQVAAGVAIFVRQAAMLLDVSQPRQHRYFLWLNGVSLVTVIVTRLFHWPVLIGQIAMVWYKDQAWVYLGFGLPICLLFTVYNHAYCVVPMVARMRKFWNLPVDIISNKGHPSSMAKVSQAAIAMASPMGAAGTCPGNQGRSIAQNLVCSSYVEMDLALKRD